MPVDPKNGDNDESDKGDRQQTTENRNSRARPPQTMTMTAKTNYKLYNTTTFQLPNNGGNDGRLRGSNNKTAPTTTTDDGHRND